jgi:hypothetical protein
MADHGMAWVTPGPSRPLSGFNGSRHKAGNDCLAADYSYRQRGNFIEWRPATGCRGDRSPGSLGAFRHTGLPDV